MPKEVFHKDYPYLPHQDLLSFDTSESILQVALGAFEKVLLRESGPVLASEKDQIAWNGKNKETFAVEERQLVVYKVPGGQLVEFQSVVRTTGGPVLLDGDPQHAGFHFRAGHRRSRHHLARHDGAGLDRRRALRIQLSPRLVRFARKPPTRPLSPTPPNSHC